MELFSKAFQDIFSSRRSSVPPALPRKDSTRRKNDGGSGSSAPGGFNPHAGSASARRAGKRDDGVHGIMTSALWAVARTPALVEAIERVEAEYNDEVSPLCLILSRLRHTHEGNHRQAAEAADEFLRTSPLTLHDHMEPMDAIRAIVGLCADSELVLEEAVSTTYR